MAEVHGERCNVQEIRTVVRNQKQQVAACTARCTRGYARQLLINLDEHARWGSECTVSRKLTVTEGLS